MQKKANMWIINGITYSYSSKTMGMVYLLVPTYTKHSLSHTHTSNISVVASH